MMISSTGQLWNKFTVLIVSILILITMGNVSCSEGRQDVGDGFERLFGQDEDQSAVTEEDTVDLVFVTEQVVDRINSQDYQGALEALEELKSDPEYDFYWAAYAEAFIDTRLGLYDDALELVNSLDPGPFHTEILKLRAEIYIATHRLGDARYDLETIILSGTGADSLVRNRIWEIGFYWGDVLLMREMEEELQTPHDLDTNDMFMTFEITLLDRDFLAASQALDRLLNLPYTIGNPMSPYYKPNILRSRARLAYEQGEVERAFEILREVNSDHPDVTIGYSLMALYGLNTGRYGEARSVALEGIMAAGGGRIGVDVGLLDSEILTGVDYESIPLRINEVSDLLFIVGMTSLANGGVEEALRCADTANEVNEYKSDAYFLKSCALEIQNDITGAIGTTLAGMRMDPDSTELAIRYVSLARFAPAAVGPTDPESDVVLEDAMVRLNGRHEMYPLDPSIAFSLATALDLANQEGSNELFALAYEDSQHRVDFVLGYAGSLALSGNLDEAKLIIAGGDIPCNLVWLVRLFRTAEITDSADLYEFTEWLWGFMDPEHTLAPVLESY